jgi:hypothetical protein
LPLAGDRKAFPYLRTESNEQWGQVSPNGRWLAYASDESKRFEVYVQTFPNPGDKSQVSIDGCTLPVWSRSGKELFYIAQDGKMMAASVKGAAQNDSARFEADTPKALFDVRLLDGVGARYDVGNDGRFLIAAPIKPPGGQQITVVVNWMTALKKMTAKKGYTETIQARAQLQINFRIARDPPGATSQPRRRRFFGPHCGRTPQLISAVINPSRPATFSDLFVRTIRVR